MQPVCVLSIAYFSRNYLDDKNPDHLTYVRLAFGFSVCLVLLLDLLIYFSISSRGDTSETKIEAKNPQTGQMEVFNSKKEYDLVISRKVEADGYGRLHCFIYSLQVADYGATLFKVFYSH